MIDALVSGEVARAVFIQGNDVEYIDFDNPEMRIKTTRTQIGKIFEGARDVESVKIEKHQDIFKLAIDKYFYDRGLRLLDLIISEDDGNDIVVEAAHAFECIVREHNVLDRIKNVALSVTNPHLPLGDDHFGLLDKFPILKELIDDLSVAQIHVIRLREALAAALSRNSVYDSDEQNFMAKVVEGGVFRRLVEAKSDGTQINSAILESFLKLKEVPKARTIVSDWTHGLLEKKTRRRIRQIEAEEEALDTQQSGAFSTIERSRHDLFVSAKLQQLAIVAKLKQQDVGTARRFTNQLVKFQIQNGGAEYAAKSLSNLANEARKLGQHSIELEWAKYATELAPEDGHAFGLLADTYLSLFRLPEANEAFQRAIDFGEDEFGVVGIARTLRASGNLEAALTAFDAARKKYAFGNKPEFAWLGYCETLREIGRFADALTSYEEATERFVNVPLIFCGKAAVFKDMGRIDDAVAIYKYVILKFPEDATAFCGLADCLKQGGLFGEAMDQYDLASRHFPGNPISICGRADVLRTMGKTDDAIQAYSEAIKLLPFEPSAFSGYAESLRDKGEYQSAIDAYEDAIKRFPLDARTRASRANMLKAARRYKDALQAYDANLKDFPLFLANRIGRASMLKQLGNYDEAQKAYTEILTTNPGYPIAVNGLAAVFVALNKLDDAEKLLSIDQPQTESEWVGYHIVGMMKLSRNQFELAIEHFEAGLKIVPFIRQRNIFRQALALAHMKRKEYGQALEVLENFGDTFEQLLSLHCLGKLNELDRAKTVLDAMNDNIPPKMRAFRLELVAQIGLTSIEPQHDEVWLFEQEREFILQAA